MHLYSRKDIGIMWHFALSFFLPMAVKNCKGKNDIACHAQEPMLVH